MDKQIQKEEEEEEKAEENNDDLSQSNLKYDKIDIGKRKNIRHLSKKSGKSLRVDSKGMSSNQGVNIYNLKKSGS